MSRSPSHTRSPRHAETTPIAHAAALARLGAFALANSDLQAVMEEATRIVAETLEADLAGVLERSPTGDHFVRRAGLGYGEDATSTFRPVASQLAGYTVRSGEPVIMWDVRVETRFECPPLLREAGVVSGLSVVIRVPGHDRSAYGAFVAFKREHHTFTQDDIDFLQAAANVIGSAILRRRSEERLWESEERFNLLANAVADGAMFPLDPDGSVVGWNAPAERMHGYRSEEIVGRRLSSLFTVDDVERGLPEAMQRTAMALGHAEGDGWLLRRDGSKCRANVAVFALRGEGGTLRGFSVFTRDETERYAAEAERLRLLDEIDHQRCLLQSVIDQLPVGLSIMDATSGRMLVHNAELGAIWRRPGSPLDASQLSTRYPARSAEGRRLSNEDYAGARATRGESVRQQLELERGDGTTCIVVETGAPLRDREGRVVAGMAVVIDVTAAKEAERERERLLDETQRAVRAREDVLAVVSHDLRSPLSTIALGANQVIRMGSDADLGRAQVHARRILRATERMEHIILDLLDISRIETGRLAIETGDHDGAGILAEAIDMFADLAAEKQIHLQSAAEPLRAPIRCDRDRAMQVLSNLIGNAIKFTGSGGQVAIGGAPEGAHAVFFVRDGGPGIHAEDLPHVFDRYWQAKGTGAQKKGLGLGLAIAKGIVEAHGGRIWADSVAGRGTTFFFSLPLGAGPRRR
jgi:PAS domain S-box-containing protein